MQAAVGVKSPYWYLLVELQPWTEATSETKYLVLFMACLQIVVIPSTCIMEHHVIHYVALIVLKLIKELIYGVNSCGIEYLIKHEVTHALIEHKKFKRWSFLISWNWISVGRKPDNIMNIIRNLTLFMHSFKLKNWPWSRWVFKFFWG